MSKQQRESPAVEPETTYPVTELIARAPAALGVSPEVVAGALSGCTDPLTITEALKRVTAFLNQEVR